MPARPLPPGRGLLLGGIFHRPVSPTSHPFTWSRADRLEGPIHALPRTGAELRSRSSPRRGGRWAQRLGSPVSPHPSDSPSRAYLSWRCTHRSTQLKSHPSALLPRVPAKPGARKPERNKCAWMPRRAELGAAKLAGGRRGRWLCCAGCRALGSRPGRRPRRPAPSPPPPRAAAPGPDPGPRCRGARLGAGAGARGLATPAGCAWRWQRLLLRGEDPGDRRSSRYHSEHWSWSPGTRGPKGRSWRRRAPPSLSFTLSSPDEPAEPLPLPLPRRRGGGWRSCHSSSGSRRRTPSPCGWIPPCAASPPPGEPRPKRSQLARSALPRRTVTPDSLR